AAIADRLAKIVKDPTYRPDQLFVTSHSRSTYALAQKGPWYGMEMKDGVTQGQRHEDEDGLNVVFSEKPLPPPRSQRLQPGNLVWLPLEITRHIGVETGDLLQPLLGPSGEARLTGPSGEVRLMSEERLNELERQSGPITGEKEQ